VSFAAITLCVASQRMFIIVVVIVYFVIDSVRKLLDTSSYMLSILSSAVLVRSYLYNTVTSCMLTDSKGKLIIVFVCSYVDIFCVLQQIGIH
jgi:hypothetical protein